MSWLARFFASAVLIFSFFAFMPGSAEARWYGGHWHGGWRGGLGWGPAFGARARIRLGLGLSIRLLPRTILLRATSAAGLRLGARARLAQRALGVSPRVALLVNESPPRGGLSASF